MSASELNWLRFEAAFLIFYSFRVGNTHNTTQHTTRKNKYSTKVYQKLKTTSDRCIEKITHDMITSTCYIIITKTNTNNKRGRVRASDDHFLSDLMIFRHATELADCFFAWLFKFELARVDDDDCTDDGDELAVKCVSLSMPSTSLRICLALSCLQNILSALRAFSCTFDCVSWHAMSSSFCGSFSDAIRSENL